MPIALATTQEPKMTGLRLRSIIQVTITGPYKYIYIHIYYLYIYIGFNLNSLIAAEMSLSMHRGMHVVRNHSPPEKERKRDLTPISKQVLYPINSCVPLGLWPPNPRSRSLKIAIPSCMITESILKPVTLQEEYIKLAMTSCNKHTKRRKETAKSTCVYQQQPHPPHRQRREPNIPNPERASCSAGPWFRV